MTLYREFAYLDIHFFGGRSLLHRFVFQKRSRRVPAQQARDACHVAALVGS